MHLLRTIRFIAAVGLVAGAPGVLVVLSTQPAEAATVFTVSSNADSGVGTLRFAVTAANAATGDSEIDINAGLPGAIALLSALPTYNGGTGGNGALTVKGNDATITGPSSGNVFSTSSSGAASFDSLTINGGGDIQLEATSSASITLTNSTLRLGNVVGIDTNSGDVTVTDSTISGEAEGGVTLSRGAVTVTNSRLTRNGGNGILGLGANTVVVTDSTIDANNNDGIGTGSLASVAVKDSTFTGNEFDAINLGTGITLDLAYDTIDQNDTNNPGGAQIEAGGGTVTSFGTVITRPGRLASDCSTDATMTSQGYNYVDDATCQFTLGTDKSSAFNPLLGALGSNGGSTPTELPQTGSPLIDAIPTSACQTGLASGITADQREIARPQGPGCDVGAVEVAVATTPTTTTTTPTTTATTTPTQIAGATTPHTGEPFAGSEPLVMTGVGGGIGLILLGIRSRRRRARLSQ